MQVMRDVMVDLETLDVSETALIVSIGAIRFDCSSDLKAMSDMPFYRVLDLNQQGRTVNADTIRWWMAQNDKARKVFNSKEHAYVELPSALEDFALYCQGAERIWANDPQFDVTILRNAFAQNNMAFPDNLSYWTERSFRTAKQLMQDMGLSTKSKDPLEAHNALYDAVYQAECILGWMHDLGAVLGGA
jgi:hypothetical protein